MRAGSAVAFGRCLCASTSARSRRTKLQPSGPHSGKPPCLPAVTEVQVNNNVVVNLTKKGCREPRSIEMFNAIIGEQRKMAASDSGLSDVAAQSIPVLEVRVKELQVKFLNQTTELSPLSNLNQAERPRLADYPQKSFGNLSKGALLHCRHARDRGVLARATHHGSRRIALQFEIRRLKGEHNKTRKSISLAVSDVDTVQKALVQIVKWSQIAHEKHIWRGYGFNGLLASLQVCVRQRAGKSATVRPARKSFSKSMKTDKQRDAYSATRVALKTGTIFHRKRLDAPGLFQTYFN